MHHGRALTYNQSLVWINLQKPTDDELDMYPIIEMTSDIKWNPSDDINTTTNNIINKEEPPDIEKVISCLGWKPNEVVEKTLQATTQYTKNVLRFPMRQHYKARN